MLYTGLQFGEIFPEEDQLTNYQPFANLKNFPSKLFSFTPMSLSELQASVDSISAWKAILWCFNPILVLVTLELLARTFDDDDDQDGGKMIPIMQGT